MTLDRISFKMHEGESLGFWGSNGAGKTTAMRILTTYLYPSSGTAMISGVDILQNPIEVRKQKGYLPETAPLYADMQVNEHRAFVGSARKMKGKLLEDRTHWVKDICGIKEVWKHTISELSKGYRQRVGLAQASYMRSQGSHSISPENNRVAICSHEKQIPDWECERKALGGYDRWFIR